MKKIVPVLYVTAITVLLFVSSAYAAGQTRTRARTGTYQDSDGNSGTSDTSTTVSPGSKEQSATWTNQNGQTGSHTQASTWNKTTNTGTVSSSTTLTNGKKKSRKGTVAETAPNTYDITGTKTGLNGQTSSFDQTKVKTDAGSTTTGTITGPKGVSNLDSTTTKSANGYTKDTTITGPKGGATTTDTTVTRSTGETVKSTEGTSPKGKTEDRVVDTKYNADGSGTRTIENNGPDGKTYTRTETFSARPIRSHPRPKAERNTWQSLPPPRVFPRRLLITQNIWCRRENSQTTYRAKRHQTWIRMHTNIGSVNQNCPENSALTVWWLVRIWHAEVRSIRVDSCSFRVQLNCSG